MWSDTTQIKDLHLSCMIDKVQNTTTAPNPQSSHIVSIATYINDILASSVQRPNEEGILLVDNEIKSDCIGQHIMPYLEADNNNFSKLNLSPMFTVDFISTWVALLVLNSVHTCSQTRNKFCTYLGFKDSRLRSKNNCRC